MTGRLDSEVIIIGGGATGAGIARDCADARAWFAAHAETRRQTTRDRI